MEFVKELINKGYLAESSLLNYLKDFNLSEDTLTEIFNEIIKTNSSKIITKSLFEEILSKINSYKEENKPCSDNKTNEEIIKRETIFKDIEVYDEIEIKPKKISVNDFVKYFKDRYLNSKNYFKNKNLDNLCSIGKLSKQQRRVSIIGLVYNKRITKNGNIILELEDLTGMVPVLIRQDSEELFKKAEEIVLDEAIAIKGIGSREIIFANEIYLLDTIKEIKRCQEEVYMAFISDLHVGSKKFLEEKFLNFISWLNGEIGDEKQKEISKKVKYLFIVGDCVDGIGVYPKQESELLIKDIREQYKKLAFFLNKIRKDIKIILCPGGKHDAVCQIEPQPKISKEIAPELYEIENLLLVQNPSFVNVASSKDFSGFDVLIYHGDSFDYYMDSVESLRLNNAKNKPDLITHFLLKKRHLAPTYGSTTFYPHEKDFFLIKKIPDILVSGHIHKSAVSRYNGILTISCSCWQSKTNYQEKFGHEPDPCKVPLLNLKTGKVSILDFN